MPTKIFQTENARRRIGETSQYLAGALTIQRVEFTFDEDVVAADHIIELMALPTGHRLHSIDLVGENITDGVTGTLGFMDGEYGDSEDLTRTIVTQFDTGLNFDNQRAEVDFANLSAIEPVSGSTAIGLTLSADLTANGEKLTVILTSYQDLTQ